MNCGAKIIENQVSFLFESKWTVEIFLESILFNSVIGNPVMEG